MRKFKNYFLSFLLSLSMIAGTTTPILADETDTNQNTGTETGQDTVTSGDIYHDIITNSDGTLSIVQRNKVRSGSVYTRTIAYNATNLSTGETITIGRQADMTTESVSTDPVTGWDYVTVTTTLSVADSAKLKAAALSGQLQMDNVMALTLDGGNTFSAKWDGTQVVRDQNFALANASAKKILADAGGDGAFGYGEMDAYIKVLEYLGFADPQGFKTNFEKTLKLLADGTWVKLSAAELKDKLEEVEEELEKEKEKEEEENNKANQETEELFRVHSDPTIEYYNDSRNYTDAEGSHKGFADVYDLDNNGTGIIIPSSERYITGITASAYAGTFALGMHKTVNDDISLSGFYYESVVDRFEWEVVRKVWDGSTYDPVYDYNKPYHDDPEDPDKVTGYEITDWEKHLDPVYGWKTHTYVEEYTNTESETSPYWEATGYAPALNAYYLYIYDLDIYDFDSATTTNQTFGTETAQTGTQTFHGSDSHTLSTIEPQEDVVTGDPIGPVNAGDIETISSRPTYNVNFLGGIEAGGTGTDGSVPHTDFTPNDEEHVKWTTVHFDPAKEAEEKDLGPMRTNVGYWGNGKSDPLPAEHKEVGANASQAQVAANKLVTYWVGDGHVNDTTWLNEVHLTHCDMKGYAEYKNDTFSIGYSAQEIVGSGNDGDVIWEENESHSDTYRASDKSKWPSYLKSPIGSIQDKATTILKISPEKETYESSPAFGLSQQYIQKTMDNGEYLTEYLNSVYNPVAAYSGSTNVAPSGVPKGGNWPNNNPIIVQTPVVAPVVMYDDPDTGAKPDSTMAIAASNQANRTTQHSYNTTSGDFEGRDDSLIQLRLDESYWFKFDALEHLSTQGYADWTTGTPFDNTWDTDNIKFDKYVQAKYVHFPFAVCLYTQDSSKPKYYPLVEDENEDGYWIEIYGPHVSESNLEWTRFYIPTWALEGAYTGEKSVKYKVESINVNDRGNLDSAQHDLRNDNGDLADATEDDHQLYVATYKIGVQVSGWIYDFQIVGINNRDSYDTQLSDSFSNKWHDLLYPFAWNYEEKKTGSENRLGSDAQGRYSALAKYVRYTRTGEIAEQGDRVENGTLIRGNTGIPYWSNKDIVTLDKTKSHKYEDAGTAPKGTTFAFSVKTISNLWHDGDSIQITPTLTYVADDNTVYSTDSGLYVYYNDSTGELENLYIPWQSDRNDVLVKSVSLTNTMFNGAYFDEDLEKTVLAPEYDAASASFTNRNAAAEHSASELAKLVNNFKNKQVDSYTMSNITLNSDLRLFTGNVAELKENMQYDRDSSDIRQLQDMYTIDDADLAAVESCIHIL